MILLSSSFWVLRQVPWEKPVIQLLAEMETGDTWNDAELWTIYSYVRQSKLLRLPEPFKAVLFTHAC